MIKTPNAAWRPWLAAGILIAIATAGSVVAWRWRRERPIPALGLATLEVVPGVTMLAGLGPSAAYVVETSAGLVLVDSGLEADAAPLKARMADRGLDWRSIKAILLTHAHGDHCGGAETLRTTTGAKVYAGQGDADVIRSGGPRDAVFSTFYMPNHSPHPTTVDVPLKGDEVLDFGDVRFRAIACPGHTPGSICYLMERGPLRALFSGDVIMQLGGEKAVGIYSAYLAPRYRGDARAYLATLLRLREMPVPDLLFPGHPFSDVSPQSPHLTQKRWEDLLDDAIRDMGTLVARYDMDGADFLDGEPKALLPGLYYFGDLDRSAVYGFVDRSKLYLVGTPNPRLAEFVADRARTLKIEATEPAAILLTSCDAGTAAGPTVVTAATNLDGLKSRVAPGASVVSAEDLARSSGMPLRAIPLRGPGDFPVAYVLSWAGKTVLFSGGIPIMVDHQSMERLTARLDESPGNTMDFLASVHQLDGIKPDLWLPAIPSDGQNADLYDAEWKEIVGNNYRIVYNRLARNPGSLLPRFVPTSSSKDASAMRGGRPG